MNISGNHILGCMDTPFLASCRCRTPKWVHDLPNSGVQQVSFFFLFFFFHFFDTVPTRCQHMSDTSNMPTVKKKEKKKKRKKITDFETHISSSQPTLPLISACCCCSLSLAGARSGQSASSIDVDAMACPFRSLFLSAWTIGSTSSLVLFSLCFFFFFFFFSRY